MAGWALDLGTMNSAVACWDESLGKPRLIDLPAICRKLEAKDPLEGAHLVPSAVDFIETSGFLDRLGGWPPLARAGGESVTARDAAHAFLRELLREVKRMVEHRVHHPRSGKERTA